MSVPRMQRTGMLLVAIALMSGVVVGQVSVANGQATPSGSPAASPAASPGASPIAQGGGVAAAATWLVGQQADDGGFLGFEGVSDPSVTADALLSLVAAKEANGSADVDEAIERGSAYLEDQSGSYAETGAGSAAKIALAALAVGADPASFGGADLLSIVEDGMNEDTGVYGNGVYDHALAMLALSGAGREIPEEALTALETIRSTTGGWSFDGNPEPAASDTNTTAMVIQALVAAGQGGSGLIASGLDFLRTAQDENGAFAFQPVETFTADGNSTALVVQALIAAGEDPASDTWGNAAAALAAFQNPSGAFRYADDQPDDNIFTTVQAVPVVAGLTLPILPAGSVPGTPAATPAARIEWRVAA